MNRSKKNILLIIPNLDFGGAQNSFYALSQELSKTHNVINVVFNKHNMANYIFKSTLLELDLGNASTFISKIFSFLKRTSRLKKIKKEHNIDVAISFLEGADYINILSKKKEKLILSIRGSKLNDPNISGVMGWFRIQFLIPFLYKIADNIVTVNKDIKEEIKSLVKINDDDIQVIHNHYNHKDILEKYNQPINQEILDIPIYKTTIFTHCRLTHEKGLNHLISVFKEAKKEKNELSLIIVGDGADKQQLIDLCKSYNLITYTKESVNNQSKFPYDVVFLGYQDNPLQFLKLATIFTLTSLTEGFPNSLAEAIGCGKLCLSTDCSSGVREILSHKDKKLPEIITKRTDSDYGIILPLFETKNNEKNIKIWSKTIINALDNQELIKHYEASALKRISTFSKEEAMKKWNNLIN